MNTPFISVTCDKCSRAFKVKPEAVGRNVKCPKCSHRLTVEAVEVAETSTPPPVPELGPKRAESAESDFFEQIASLDLSSESKPLNWEGQSPEFQPYQTPVPPQAITGSAMTATREVGFDVRKYPALQIVQTILRVLAIVSLVIAGGILGLMLVSLVASLAQTDSESAGFLFGFSLFSGITTSAPFLISALMLFSYAELIKVFLDIQTNTQRTAHFLRNLTG